MSFEESDTEIQTNKSKENNVVKNPEAKKISTKDMIHQALTDLKTRKGTSLHAIKKYIKEKYKVDVEKSNYIIKKSIKTSVEAGTIVQIKGVGASGSFKLAPKKPKPEKKTNAKSVKIDAEKQTTIKTSDKKEKVKKTTEKSDSQKPKRKVKIVNKAESSENKEKSKKNVGAKTKKEMNIKTTNNKAEKMAEGITRTPAKKKSAMMKRKSIGSIIKPPKMNPKKK